MKEIERESAAVLFTTRNKVVLRLSVTIQMKATEQCFPVVLFIMLYKLILTFKSMDEILKFDHSNESYRTVSTFLWCCLLSCTR